MVRLISAAETIAVRWPILRPGFPRESAVFPGDDLDPTMHFGAFTAEGLLVGVASIYLAPMPEQPSIERAWQLRGMATLPEVRGAGHGRDLVAACVHAAQKAGGEIIWCNARIVAVPFYAKHGWETMGPEFDIPTVGPHFRMWRKL
jgi:predicted GNAT family N-acyltransferase